MIAGGKQLVVYLVGPITGCSYNGCTEWRNAVKEDIESCGIYHVLTPMRGKEFLKDEKSIKPFGYDGIASDHAVFARDTSDVDRSDVLLVNFLGAEKVSIGSVMEIARAQARGKFVVTVMDGHNIHDHMFVREASSIIFRTLEEAVNYLKHVYDA